MHSKGEILRYNLNSLRYTTFTFGWLCDAGQYIYVILRTLLELLLLDSGRGVGPWKSRQSWLLLS